MHAGVLRYWPQQEILASFIHTTTGGIMAGSQIYPNEEEQDLICDRIGYHIALLLLPKG